MPTVQELLTELRQHTEHAPDPEAIRKIVQAVFDLEMLLAAFFPPTKHYFITMEQEEPTAVLFSNRDSFEQFAERCKEQGLYTAAIENTKENREILFADLYRCGFTQILLDYAPTFLVLPITDFFTPPDDADLPLLQRPFPAPALTGSILYLFQQIHSGKADGTLELEMLRQLYHTPLFMPVQKFQAEGNTAYHVAGMEQDGKRTAHLFTDRFEWVRFGVSEEFSPAVARFAEWKTLLQSGFEQLIVNPGSGAELILDAALLDAAEQAAMGEISGLHLKSMQEKGEKITITDPETPPAALLQALSDILKEQESVHAAYLRVLKRENLLHPSWLVLLESPDDPKNRKELHRALSTAAQPHLGNYDIEFTDYASAPEFAGNVKPFYRRKKRGLFR